MAIKPNVIWTFYNQNSISGWFVHQFLFFMQTSIVTNDSNKNDTMLLYSVLSGSTLWQFQPKALHCITAVTKPCCQTQTDKFCLIKLCVLFTKTDCNIFHIQIIQRKCAVNWIDLHDVQITDIELLWLGSNMFSFRMDF